jgi:hypothetical protein
VSIDIPFTFTNITDSPANIGGGSSAFSQNLTVTNTTGYPVRFVAQAAVQGKAFVDAPFTGAVAEILLLLGDGYTQMQQGSTNTLTTQPVYITKATSIMTPAVAPGDSVTFAVSMMRYMTGTGAMRFFSTTFGGSVKSVRV